MWLSAGCAMFVAATAASASSDVTGAIASSKEAAAKSGKTAGGARASGSTSILGAAWKADNSPIPNAKVRLRNKKTGRVEATAVANEIGQFAFTGIEDGEFVIELVSDSGKVLALGLNFLVAPGDTIVTFVRQGTAPPSWISQVFEDNSTTAASTTSAAAASTGITAMAPEEVRPVSGRQ
jgi:hypothetical protein